MERRRLPWDDLDGKGTEVCAGQRLDGGHDQDLDRDQTPFRRDAHRRQLTWIRVTGLGVKSLIFSFGQMETRPRNAQRLCFTASPDLGYKCAKPWACLDSNRLPADGLR